MPRSSTIMGVIRRVCDDEPRPIREINPDVPDWLSAIVERLLARKREDRFQAAEEVATLLAECLAHVQQPLSVPLPKLLKKSEAPALPLNTARDSTADDFAREPALTATGSAQSVDRPSRHEAGIDEPAVESARERIRQSGRLLRWAGVLNAAFYSVFELYVFISDPRELDDVTPFVLLGLLASWAIYYGGRRLAQGNSAGWPTLAALLCWLSPPGWLVGIPAAFSTRKTLREENVKRLLARQIHRVRAPGELLTKREFATVVLTGFLAMFCSVRTIICLIAFAVPVGLIWIDLTNYHFVPMVESLVMPAGVVGLLIIAGVFISCFSLKHGGLRDFGGTVTSFSLFTLLGIILTAWSGEVSQMGYVQVRISTPGAVVSLRRPNGGIELMFGKNNWQTVQIPAGQTVRIPAGPWEWSVHLGATEPLMSERFELAESGVTILEPTIPRGRDVITGEFSTTKTTRRATSESIPWLREPGTVVIQDGKLSFHFDDGSSQTWLAEFDTKDTNPLNLNQLPIDLRDPETNVVAAIGTYSVSETGLELRLSPTHESRPTQNPFNPSGEEALATFYLKRVPTLDSLRGTWKPVAEQTAGREVRGAGNFVRNLAQNGCFSFNRGRPVTDALNYVWQFSGDLLVSKVATEVFRTGKVHLEDHPSGPRLTWTFEDNSQDMESKVQPMIYRLRRDGQGELLEVAFKLPPIEFPTQLESTSENGQAWIQFRRQE